MTYILYNPLSGNRNAEEEAKFLTIFQIDECVTKKIAEINGKHTEMVAIHTGHEINVKFDRPTALQIDAETFLGVTGNRIQR